MVCEISIASKRHWLVLSTGWLAGELNARSVGIVKHPGWSVQVGPHWPVVPTLNNLGLLVCSSRISRRFEAVGRTDFAHLATGLAGLLLLSATCYPPPEQTTATSKKFLHLAAHTRDVGRHVLHAARQPEHHGAGLVHHATGLPRAGAGTTEREACCMSPFLMRGAQGTGELIGGFLDCSFLWGAAPGNLRVQRRMGCHAIISVVQHCDHHHRRQQPGTGQPLHAQIRAKTALSPPKPACTIACPTLASGPRRAPLATPTRGPTNS